MKYLIFLRNRIGGGRYFAYFNSGYYYVFDERKGSFTVPQRDVKRSYLKK